MRDFFDMLKQSIINFENHVDRRNTSCAQSFRKQAERFQQIDQIFDL